MTKHVITGYSIRFIADAGSAANLPADGNSRPQMTQGHQHAGHCEAMDCGEYAYIVEVQLDDEMVAVSDAVAGDCWVALEAEVGEFGPDHFPFPEHTLLAWALRDINVA
jgi:hypothetical protein